MTLFIQLFKHVVFDTILAVFFLVWLLLLYIIRKMNVMAERKIVSDNPIEERNKKDKEYKKLNEGDPDDEYTPNVPTDEVYETGMVEDEFNTIDEDDPELTDDEREDQEDNVDRLQDGDVAS
ncbi:MAG: hypothetical protein EHM58_16835 [Ignavibacteriae bacterium]|nr:MAG: hypothetical protein EHM58_16835 [Ignavibacteriota bacterium]